MPILPPLQFTKFPKHPSPFLYKGHNPAPYPHWLSTSSQLSFFISRVFIQFFQELALTQEALEGDFNRGLVSALYDALNRRDAPAIQQILAADLEWWFHGPPSHQFLMRLLTGEQDSSFRFLPHSISAFGPTVLAEGFDQSRSIAWVHAWTVTDGVITHVREYFNTSLTVTRFRNTDGITSPHCPSVWESSLPDRVGKSVPGLVLAI